jgi:hypothetical protein
MPARDKPGFSLPENAARSGLILLDKIPTIRNGLLFSSN